MKTGFTWKHALFILLIICMSGCASVHGLNTSADREAGDRAFAAKNYKDAAEKYRSAADGGDAAAQYRFGQMLAEGQGVAKNDKEAAKYILQAADHDFGPARMTAAAWYLSGKRGIPKDEKKAFEYLSKEAEQKNPAAMFSLGCLYAKGLGVEKDANLATKWFNDAKTAGYAVPDDMLYEVNIMYPKSTSSKSFKIPTGNTTLVRSVQSGLLQLGYDPGKADGKISKKTIQAVKKFQAKANMPVNGRITHSLLEKVQYELRKKR